MAIPDHAARLPTVGNYTPLGIRQDHKTSKGIVSKQNFILRNGQAVTITICSAKGTQVQDLSRRMDAVYKKLDEIAGAVFTETTYTPLEREFSAGNALLEEEEIQNVSFQFAKFLMGQTEGDKTTMHTEHITIEAYAPSAGRELESAQVEHRFLKEAPRFMCNFLDKLIERFPEKKEELEKIKQEGLQFVKDTYGSRYEQYTSGRVGRQYAREEWSKKEEIERQRLAGKHLKECLYMGLDTVADLVPAANAEKWEAKMTEAKNNPLLQAKYMKSEQTEKADPIAALHKAVVQEMAMERRLEIMKGGKIDIELRFQVTTPMGQSLGVHSHTHQYGNEILGSIDKRDGRTLVPVNGNIEQVTFRVSNGTTMTSNKLRTGSFDYYDVPPTDPTIVSHDQIAKHRDKLQLQLGKEAKLKYIDATLQKDDPSELKALIEALYQELHEDPANCPVNGKQLLEYEKILQKKELIAKFQPNDDILARCRGMMHKEPAERQAYIEKIRVERDPTKLRALQLVLQEENRNLYEKLNTASFDEKVLIRSAIKENNRLINKLKTEFYQAARDNAIIAANMNSIKGVLTNDESKQLGMDLPDIVRAAYNGNAELDGTKQGWGMISLQTPVNVISAKGFNKALIAMSNKPGLPKFVKKALLKITGLDLSELNSIDREMRAYRQAGEQTYKNCLYFNIPTNFMGKEHTIINLGPFQFKLRLSSLFNVGLIDKSRSKAIADETQRGINGVYSLTNKAIERLEAQKIALKAAQRAGEKDIEIFLIDKDGKAITNKVPVNDSLKELVKHQEALKCLRDQTFEVTTENGKEVVRLKEASENSARYETVGRLTVLMEMLNFKTTGHCRSGNNRTAAWLAKSNQILGAVAASPTGAIDAPNKTGAKLDPDYAKDHWTLPIFEKTYESSLILQKSNKGTEGTKEKVGLSSIYEGAFALAGPHDPLMFQKVRKKRAQARGAQAAGG